MTMDRTEEIAEVIADAYYGTPWAHLVEKQREGFRRAARAVLAHLDKPRTGVTQRRDPAEPEPRG
jgi:hypothetical protein